MYWRAEESGEVAGAVGQLDGLGGVAQGGVRRGGPQPGEIVVSLMQAGSNSMAAWYSSIASRAGRG